MVMMRGDVMIAVEDLPEIFNDLSPIPQNDGPTRVCVIQYPSSFTLAYNYMRAVWAAKEFSERALKLSATCLKMNPANYTVWHYRRQCLQFLGHSSDKTSIQNDLNLASSLGGSNPKNYQIWYHRRALLETHDPCEFLDSELEYIAEVLQEDSKNYHAWSYRQWILMSIDEESVWENEMEFVCNLIQVDIRNNSAWNQRWLVSHRGKKRRQSPPIGLDVARREADFAIKHGSMLDPYNESPWRYLIGILQEQCQHYKKQHQKKDNDFNQTMLKKMIVEYEAKSNSNEIRNVLITANRDPDTCVNMTSARIDLLEMIDTKDSLQTAMILADGLATKYDIIRKKYWFLVSKRLHRHFIAMESRQ